LGLVVSGQKLQNPSLNRTLQLWLVPKDEPGRESAAYDHADLDGCGGN
jgi:hypothetical protein